MATIGEKVRAFPLRMVPNSVFVVTCGVVIMVIPARNLWMGSGIVLWGALILPMLNMALYVQLATNELVVSSLWAKGRIPRVDIVELTHGRGKNRTSLRLIYQKVVPVEVASYASASRRKEIEEILQDWIKQGPADDRGRRPPTGAIQPDS